MLLLGAVVLVAADSWGPLLRIARGAGGADLPGDRVSSAWLLPLDDAYIFVRYAQQAARGRPFEWTDGEPSTGASSLLFPWLLVPGQWLADGLAGWSWWSRAVGSVGLALLGLAGIRAGRVVGLPDPWPLVGGLVLVLSGPIAFVSLAGMETGLACAALLLTVAEWCQATWRPSHPSRTTPAWRPLLLAAFLPWVRPDFAAFTLVIALALALGVGPPARRAWAPVLLVPAFLYGVLDWGLTGELEPAGAVSKSLLGAPFLDVERAVRGYLLLARTSLVPVYLGRLPEILPPPVGLAAVLVAAACLVAWLGRARSGPIRRLRALGPFALAWGICVALAPLSTHLHWHGMRHHHPGLALAWLLVTLGCGIAVETALGTPLSRERIRQLRWAALLLPLGLVPLARYWADESVRAVLDLETRKGRAAEWLSREQRDAVLLLNDAGLFSIAHDGPAIDLVGLGTPSLLEPFRHGGGAVAEALARSPVLPEIAAVNLNLLRIPGLMGERLIPDVAPWPGPASTQLVVARVRREVMAKTALQGPGIDFAYLPDERSAGLRWDPAPGPEQASIALTLPGAGGGAELHGCRLLPGRLRLRLPEGFRSVRLRASGPPDKPTGILVGEGGGSRVMSELLLSGKEERWGELQVPLPPGASELELRQVGSVLPCLESIAFQTGAGSD